MLYGSYIVCSSLVGAIQGVRHYSRRAAKTPVKFKNAKLQPWENAATAAREAGDFSRDMFGGAVLSGLTAASAPVVVPLTILFADKDEA